MGATGQSSIGLRERFIAFAFCWADMLLELDESRRVTFAAGTTDKFLGVPADEAMGKLFDGFVAAKDAILTKQVMDAAQRRKKFDSLVLHLKHKEGREIGLNVAGYVNPDLEGRYYLAFRLSPDETSDPNMQKVGKEKLYDASSFAKMAEDMVAKSGGDDAMTLLAVPGLETAMEGLEEGQKDNLLAAVGSVLKLNSSTGDAAAKMGDGKYGVVHDKNLDVDAMKNQIADVVKGMSGAEIEVDSATLDAGDSADVSEENLAKGLIYALNKFGESKKGGLTLEDLSTNIDDLANEAKESIEGFNRVVRNQDFQMAMHPIVGVNDGVIHHYEALARFNGKHGESPFKYITFAEETGLIGAFDLSVVDKVIEWLEERKDGDQAVAVNISGQSITDLRYISGLEQRLKGNDWLTPRLMFELTESARVEDLEGANNFIQKLRGMGYHVCLDDFGAGAASFQYLSAMEVDVVKVDGEAVKNAQSQPRGKAFLTALATFCKGLGVETIAEMVDDPAGVEFCRDCGIDYIQGFYLGKPSFDISDFANTKELVLGVQAA